MDGYRVYLIDHTNRIRRGHEVLCRSEAEACEKARELLAEFPKAEVWRGAKRVCTVSETEILDFGRSGPNYAADEPESHA